MKWDTSMPMSSQLNNERWKIQCAADDIFSQNILFHPVFHMVLCRLIINAPGDYSVIIFCGMAKCGSTLFELFSMYFADKNGRQLSFMVIEIPHLFILKVAEAKHDIIMCIYINPHTTCIHLWNLKFSEMEFSSNFSCIYLCLNI